MTDATEYLLDLAAELRASTFPKNMDAAAALEALIEARKALKFYACTCPETALCTPNETDLADCGYKGRAALRRIDALGDTCDGE